MEHFIENKEIINFLDCYIQSDFRETYLKLKNGTKITKLELTKLQQHIMVLMEEHNWNIKTFQENEDN